MSIPPIQRQPYQAPSARGTAKPRPQGLAQMPDRLEDRRVAPASQENPPSLFKKFLFEPLFEAIKFVIRMIFTCVDLLRDSVFEEKSAEPALDREAFLDRLRAAPRPEKILIQFSQVYSTEEQNQVYQTIGEAHEGKISWKEMIWERSFEENVELGRHLVRQNPFLLRDYLFL